MTLPLTKNQREDIGVLFATPSVLHILAEQMNAAQRERIHGVHYGGQRLDRETLQKFQAEVFPNAKHLSGYGNTLFGCCLEFNNSVGHTPCYFPFGERVVLYPDLTMDSDENSSTESQVFSAVLIVAR